MKLLFQVMLAERRDPTHEYYAAILNDLSRQTPVLVTSSQGGMNIEDVARDTPEAILTTPIDFEKGLDIETALELATKLGFKTQQTREEAADTFVKLYQLYKEKDATQIEINPLAETADGHVLWLVYPVFIRATPSSKPDSSQHGRQVRL
jgi:succinyl-CoA synthetase beta subunit